MRIKKHQNKNFYVVTNHGLYVRNFARFAVPWHDLNKLTKRGDYSLLLNNEVQNERRRYQFVDSEKFFHPNVVILSDGHDFAENHKVLAGSRITVIGVNRALAKWSVPQRSINYYVVNNPYQECMSYFPRLSTRSLPNCVASVRTNYEFLNRYRGNKYMYAPVCERTYCGLSYNGANYRIDDYRNPICAAIGLAYRFGVQRLVLLCCDDSSEQRRDGAEQLENNLWQYPEQRIAHELIDANLYWLQSQKDQPVAVRDCSAGSKYENAVYINKEDVVNFFEASNG